MEPPAKEHGVLLTTKGYHAAPLKIREVLFIDTHDLRLYNNAFILRRRIAYKDGFPAGDPLGWWRRGPLRARICGLGAGPRVFVALLRPYMLPRFRPASPTKK
jgi:hypothetical protein